jgi:hypothetical protein
VELRKFCDAFRLRALIRNRIAAVNNFCLMAGEWGRAFVFALFDQFSAPVTALNVGTKRGSAYGGVSATDQASVRLRTYETGCPARPFSL